MRIQDSHIRQFKCAGPLKWLVEEWFRVRVSVRPGNTVLPFIFFFAVDLFLFCFLFFVCLFFCEKSFDVTSVLNVTSRVLASFPGPAQLSVAISTVKRERAWYLFSRE